jgi:hypothetical protein
MTYSGNLGGPIQGYSPQQTITNYKDSESVMYRRILRHSWNTPYAVGNVNNYKRLITPFRAVNNLGDYLGRQYYVCGGSNQVQASKPGYKSLIGNMNSQCDGTGVPASVCNPKFVSDSSDYTTYKKQNAINSNYNDLKNGGNVSHGEYVAKKAIHGY